MFRSPTKMKLEKTLELTERKALNNESKNTVPLLVHCWYNYYINYRRKINACNCWAFQVRAYCAT